MAARAKIKQYLEHLKDEQNTAALYRVLAEGEKDPRIAEVYRRLALTEERHAEVWAERLRAAGARVPAFRLSWRTRVFSWLARRFGTQTVLPTLSSLESLHSEAYGRQGDSRDMAGAERSHATLLKQISGSTNQGLAGAAVAQLEGRHRTAGGNALRAAVLGASDGLLSNFNLVMGVAGAQIASKTILVTGFAGLLAGAISMALGEWISVQSSRELYEHQIRTEREEIATAPEEETEELVLIYQARGLNETSARALATQVMSNQETALDTLARDELGIDPKELGGSAWEAAVTSFILFAIGAIVPVIPFLFLAGRSAVVASAGFSAAALFLVGAAITLFTGRSVLFSGSRQVMFGLATAAFTFLVGRLIGVQIAG